MTSKITDTLAERGGRYGSFDSHADFAERINKVYESSANWETMKADAKEALRIIANKIGRILNGDPEYYDNWHDIAGYAILVEQRINNSKPAEQEKAEVQFVWGTPSEIVDDE